MSGTQLLFPPGSFAHRGGRPYPVVRFKRDAAEQGSRVGPLRHVRRRVEEGHRTMHRRYSQDRPVGVKRKRKYPRPGSRRIAMRPRVGAVVPSEIHRAYRESNVNAWPRAQAMATAPSPAAVFVPNSYQSWKRGLADGSFTGSKVTLKNISLMVQMNAPATVLTTMNTPYRLRVTAGWCKNDARVKIYPTTNAAILDEYPNGMALNQVQPSMTSPIPATDGSFSLCSEVVKDTIDDNVQINGVHQNEASYPRAQFQVISDQVINWAPTTAVDSGSNTIRTFTPKTLKFNFTCNKRLKLIPFTTSNTNPPDAAAEWFTPANDPSQWIPFVCLQMLNHNVYDNVTDLPALKFTENAFFLDN